jgi:uncharacterized protein (DUF1919 family)
MSHPLIKFEKRIGVNDLFGSLTMKGDEESLYKPDNTPCSQKVCMLSHPYIHYALLQSGRRNSTALTGRCEKGANFGPTN